MVGDFFLNCSLISFNLALVAGSAAKTRKIRCQNSLFWDGSILHRLESLDRRLAQSQLRLHVLDGVVVEGQLARLGDEPPEQAAGPVVRLPRPDRFQDPFLAHDPAAVPDAFVEHELADLGEVDGGDLKSGHRARIAGSGLSTTRNR